MKTILTITVMAILATGVLAPAFHDAYALKADNSQKLAPKAFGEKTKSKMPNGDSKHKSGFESLKKEEIIAFKKAQAQQKALEIIQQKYYRLG